MSRKIFFSNLGYAKGIDGSLRQHVGRFGRHFYNKLPVQEQVLEQLKNIITKEDPDICCFVEIDRGSRQSASLNQLERLIDERYSYHDIADKYGEGSLVGRMYLHAGKSNAFVSKEKLAFERLYFRHGTKRLIYRLELPEGISLLFAHFSLNRKTRVKQFQEIREIARQHKGETVLLADFNIMQGFRELAPLLDDGDLKVLNKESDFTFSFINKKLVLDLCIASKNLAPRINLKIIAQPFSDHAGLLVEIQD
jgi:endonuclease/exonuclease/phosphatase family metal-dependent hydrolase